MPTRNVKLSRETETALTDHWIQTSADVLNRIREKNPRVHCITNEVAVTYSANALLAVGAIPSMTWQDSEVADFVSSADALVVNLGTLDPLRLSGMRRAIDAADERAIPFVLDPVFIERSSGRLDTARELMALGPSIVRGNQNEFDALGEDIVRSTVHVVSGAVDRVCDARSANEPTRLVGISNGDPMMARVTATGCAATGLLAACAAVADDMFDAAVAATLCLGVAGEVASAVSPGPGTLQSALLDALYSLDHATLMTRGKIS